jgi:hypothetical protein
MHGEELQSAVLGLPFEDRVRVTELLVESLAHERAEAPDSAWETLVRSRLEAVRTGKIETIDGETASRFLHSLIQ